MNDFERLAAIAMTRTMPRPASLLLVGTGRRGKSEVSKITTALWARGGPGPTTDAGDGPR